MVAVLPVPFDDAREAPPLPDHLQKKILQEADRHAGGVAPKLRQLLGSPSFTSGIEKFSAQLSGSELVHTSYFYHGEVLDLISLHVAWSTAEPEKATLRGPADHALSEWFQSFKRAITMTDLPMTALYVKPAPNHQEPTPPRRKAG